VKTPVAGSVAAVGATLVSEGHAAAIVNRLLADRGRETFTSPMDMARALFDGSSKVNAALQAVAALVLLGAMAATVGGVWRMARGADGGLELAASGIFGIVGLMAAMTVVM
jgi:hypothetical protein